MATKTTPAKQPARTTAIAKKKELSVNNYIAMMAVITILSILIGGYVGYNMVKENIRNGRVLVGKLQAQADIEKKLANAESLVEKYNQMSDSQKQLIDAAMPSEADFTQFISLMESASNSSGTRMKSISSNNMLAATTPAPAAPAEGGAAAPAAAGTATTTAGPTPVGVMASIEGSYSQMTQLFRNLEMSSRPIKVSSFELKGNSGALKGDLTIETYYQGEADYSDKEETVQ